VTREQGRTRFGGTLRVDFFRSSAGELSQFFLDNTTGSLDQDDTNLSAAFSASVRVGEVWTVTTGLGRAVRHPTTLELYSDRVPATKFQISAEFMGNPGLEPEASLELDVGAVARFDRMQLDLDVFYRNIDDYITVVPDPTVPKLLPMSPDTVYRYVNAEARFLGGEARLVGQAGVRWQWRASLGYVWAEDTLLDEPVLGIPPLEAEAGVRYQTLGKRRIWVDVGGWYAARQDRVAVSRFEAETPGWAVLNVWSGMALSQRIELRAGILNALDRDYANHLNSPNPFTRERIPERGRTGYLTVRATF
jgi:iron complex outermembrane receptor protein